jgi:hypothetical protein
LVIAGTIGLIIEALPVRKWTTVEVMTLPALILRKADLMLAAQGAPSGADQSREASQWWEQGSGAGLHWPF